MRRLPLLAVLLSSTALFAGPAHADVSLDELKARFAAAEKENLKLKAEKLERENLAMKTEALEQENAKLKAETSGKSASAPQVSASTTAPVKVQQPHVAQVPARSDDVVARRAVNTALDSIPKDDPRREMTAAAHVVPVSTVSPVVQQWDGIYVGINAGYGQGEVNSWTNGPYVGSPFSTNGNPAYTMTSDSSIYSGPVAGGQIGYNHEFSNKVVVGAEADMDYVDINNRYGNNANNTNTTIVGNSIIQTNNQNGRTGINWIGTARLRLGYDLGSFMPYVTGGLAYGGVSTNGFGAGLISQNYGLGSFQNGSAGSSSSSSVQVGWAAGAGGELKVAPNWSIRGEYLYTQLGSLSYGAGATTFTSSSCNGCVPPTTLNTGTGWGQTNVGPFGIHQARIGVNYHTDWLASKPAVVAKY